MGKVELQDDLHSVSTLLSAVYNISELEEETSTSTGKYEAYNFGKNWLAGSNIQTVENAL